MALSTTEVVLVIILGVVFVIVLWMFFVERKKRNQISTQTYTRGMNLAGPGKIGLACDSDSTICVTRATQICTNPDSNNFESSQLDAMTKTGDFNPAVTVDLTGNVMDACNGKQTCVYDFTQPSTFPNAVVCDGTPHLIGTYTCVASGTSCGGST